MEHIWYSLATMATTSIIGVSGEGNILLEGQWLQVLVFAAFQAAVASTKSL